MNTVPCFGAVAPKRRLDPLQRPTYSLESLAVFEMTSAVPMGRYSAAMVRFGFDARARRFYDVHVEADTRQQIVALFDLAAALAREEPSLAAEIVFGGRALLKGRRGVRLSCAAELAGGTNLAPPSAGRAAGV
jgi:hypothetical protein